MGKEKDPRVDGQGRGESRHSEKKWCPLASIASDATALLCTTATCVTGKQ